MGKLSDLADRVAAQLGPAMLAEDAPEPDPLVVAAWHAMNALQRVAELLPGGQLAGEPDTRLRSLNDLASRGEHIVQAAMESLIAEGHDAPVIERSGPPDTAKLETATLHLTFTGDQALSLELEGCAQPGEPVRLVGPKHVGPAAAGLPRAAGRHRGGGRNRPRPGLGAVGNPANLVRVA